MKLKALNIQEQTFVFTVSNDKVRPREMWRPCWTFFSSVTCILTVRLSLPALINLFPEALAGLCKVPLIRPHYCTKLHKDTDHWHRGNGRLNTGSSVVQGLQMHLLHNLQLWTCLNLFGQTLKCVGSFDRRQSWQCLTFSLTPLFLFPLTPLHGVQHGE